MKILHTSDLHLSEDKPQTLEALKEVLKVGKKKKVDAVTIAGDIFDTAEDAEALRPKLRGVFSGNDFKIYAIPGNHDRSVYEKKLFFGEDLEVAAREPFQVFHEGGASIVAVPFESEFSSKLYSSLMEAARESPVRVLLLHCTLDIGFSARDFGDEEAISYCPVSSSTLSSLGFDYVLAGHFHRAWLHKGLDGGGQFVYPGSPISHTWGELGRRNVALVDTNRGKVTKMQLNSFYRDKLEIRVRPSREAKELRQVRRWVAARSQDDCELRVEAGGFFTGDETEFKKSLEKFSKPAVIKNYECRNVEEALKDPLYRRFMKKLKKRKGIRDKEAVKTRVIDSLSRLFVDGRLRR